MIFQSLDENNTRIGKISNLPHNIMNESINLEKLEKIEKLLIEPIKFNPGPALFNVVITAVK